MSELILCKRCHSESDDGKDHKTDLDCALKWREIAAKAFTPIMVARMKVARCRRAHHNGRKQLLNPAGESMDYCTRCIAAILVSHKMVEKWVGFFSSSAIETERGAENGTNEQAARLGEDTKSPVSEDARPNPE